MARQRSGFAQGRTRRRTGWEEGPGGVAVTQYTGTSVKIHGSAASSLVDGLTVARIRGLWRCFLNGTVTAAGDGYQGAIGIGIATDLY